MACCDFCDKVFFLNFTVKIIFFDKTTIFYSLQDQNSLKFTTKEYIIGMVIEYISYAGIYEFRKRWHYLLWREGGVSQKMILAYVEGGRGLKPTKIGWMVPNHIHQKIERSQKWVTKKGGTYLQTKATAI